MKKGRLTALVPVRAGSQRVKNKNLKPFAGSNLLEIKIRSLLQIPIVDDIIVTSDSEEMLELADKLGVTVHKREPYYAGSECTNSEFFENLATVPETEHVLYAPVTCPMISKETMMDIINKYFSSFAGHDSIITVKEIKHHLWLNGEPLNYDPATAPNSQNLPDIVAITYGICILERKTMLNNKNIIGNRINRH